MNATQDKSFLEVQQVRFHPDGAQTPGGLPRVQGDLRIQECDLLFAGMRRGRQY